MRLKFVCLSYVFLCFTLSCKTLNSQRNAGADGGDDGGSSSLSGLEESQDDSYVLTAWFRASEAALMSDLKFPIDASRATFITQQKPGQKTVAEVRLLPNFLPSNSQALIRLNLMVSILGTGSQSQSGVTVTGGVSGNAMVTKDLALDLNGGTASPAQLRKDIDPLNPNIYASGLLRRLKTRIANRKYWEQIGAHVATADNQLSKIPSKIDANIDTAVKMITKTWQETFVNPFLKGDTSGTKARLFTAEDSLNFAVFQKESTLGTKVKRIVNDPWDQSAAVLLVHGAQIEYQMNHLLKDRVISLAELKEQFCKFDLGVTLCSKQPQNGVATPDQTAKSKDDDRKIKFYKSKALSVKFHAPNQKDYKYPALEIEFYAGFSPNLQQTLQSTIVYEVDLQNKQARRRSLKVDALSQAKQNQLDSAKPSNDQNASGEAAQAGKPISGNFLGAWDSINSTVGEAFATLAETVFRKTLPEVIKITPVAIPKVGELQPKTWTIDDGWLRVSWDFKPWNEIRCDSVNSQTVYDGFSCNRPYNGMDACWEYRGTKFYGNINGWIRCGNGWMNSQCSSFTTQDVFYGKKCRHSVNGQDLCFYYTGADEAGNINGWKPCPDPNL